MIGSGPLPTHEASPAPVETWSVGLEPSSGEPSTYGIWCILDYRTFTRNYLVSDEERYTPTISTLVLVEPCPLTSAFSRTT